MWLRRSLFAALVLFVGLSTLAIGQEKKDEKKDDKKDDKNKAKATLVWKLEKDKPFWQKMKTETNQTMKVQNQEVKQTQTQTFNFKYTPTKKDDDAWTITQTIDGLQMDIDIGGTKIIYDSYKPDTATNPLGEFFKALVGSETQRTTFTLTVSVPKDKEATVTKIEGQKEFVEKLVKANPQMQPLLNQILSEKALIEMAQPTFGALPGKEVTQGQTWTRTSVLDMGPIGKYENEYTYTYEGPEKDSKLEIIKVESKLKYKEPPTEGGVGGLPFRIKKANLKSDPAKGTIKYDPALGRIVSTKMELKLTGDLEIEIGGQTTKVELDQTQTTEVENTEKSQFETKPK
jgi:hypothetical protein